MRVVSIIEKEEENVFEWTMTMTTRLSLVMRMKMDVMGKEM